MRTPLPSLLLPRCRLSNYVAIRRISTNSGLFTNKIRYPRSVHRNCPSFGDNGLHSSNMNTRRWFSETNRVEHGHLAKPKPGEELHVTFITKEGKQVHLEVAPGDNLLDIAQANDLEMEGACGGSCACSTCHVIVDPEYYDKMEEPSDDENDMLDLAFGLTETSRLGCQIVMTKELDGLRVALPAMTRNLQAKDFGS